jgi:predicted alpha/beta superfamily hydrolase
MALAQTRAAAHAPVEIAGAVQFDVTSKTNGRAYRVFVSAPPGPAPAGGWPMVVLTDGNLSFPIGAMMGRVLAMEGDSAAALVVAVGYPSQNPPEFLRRRVRDLTPPTPLANIRRPPPGQPPLREDEVGDAEGFFRFLTEELPALIAADWPVNGARTALYGHSLGGLFVLQALFDHPGAYRSFVASSPSIWWNNRALLAGEAGFARQVTAKEVAPRVLITIGGYEQSMPARLPPGMDEPQMRSLIEEARMVDNARELGARLAQLEGGPGYLARFTALDGDDHGTALSTSIGRALAFALRS